MGMLLNLNLKLKESHSKPIKICNQFVVVIVNRPLTILESDYLRNDRKS